LIVGEDDSNLQGERRQGLFMKQKGSGFRSIAIFPSIEKEHLLDDGSIGAD